MYKIAFVDTLGLCYDGSTLEKRGLGGSESAVIFMSRELAKIGFEVTVFNDCVSDDASPGVYDNVTYKSLHDIEQYENYFDIFIASRSVVSFSPDHLKSRFKWAERLPNIEKVSMSSRLRILWMHDTFCDGDDLIEDYVLQGRIHEIFTLSDWHTTYVTNCNHGKRRNFEVLKKHIFQTRNGIHKHIDWVDVSKKDPNLFVYNASVSKGMIPLVEKIWPLVKKELPDVKLKIIGGYYRFRSDHGPDEQEKKFHELKNHAIENDIEFTGIIRQDEIAHILANASYMIYPAAFPETFGISSLESLAYNTPIITCRFGALEETAFDLSCYKIPYAIEPNGLFPNIDHESQVNRFVDAVVNVYRNPYLHQQKMYACNQVKDICTWDTVALQWKQHFFKSFADYLDVNEYRKVSRINNRVHKVFGRRFSNEEEFSVNKREQQKIVAIVPVYNAENYIEKCLKSIASQDYDNYRVLIIDDCSTDNTRTIIHNFIEHDDRFELIANDVNRGAVYNQIYALRQCDENDIVMLIDGDDALLNNPNIFHLYNNVYHDGAEYTYGSCWSMADNIPLIAQPYPPEIKERRAYREHKFNWNMPYPHLRTFRARIAKNLPDNLFQNENGEWYRAGGDNATFYNIIEQAEPDRVVCVSDVVYLYNDMNPLNDYKIHGKEQNETANKIIGKKMSKYSIVVPTMWKANQVFLPFLDILVNHPNVDEIIIIDNNVQEKPDSDVLNNSKIKYFNFGKNIYVNPSWNFGVSISQNDKICLLNDDLAFDTNLFEKVDKYVVSENGVIGLCAGISEFNQPPITDGTIDIKIWQGEHTYGFGCLMFLHKKEWDPIPDGLDIYFGDNYIFDTNLKKGKNNYIITNMKHTEQFAQTTSDKLLTDGFLEREQVVYNRIMMNKKRILIAIPTAKYIEPDTFKSIYDLEVPDGYEVKFQYFYGYNIDQVRNLIADWVIKDYDYLFSVDSDVSFAPDTLKKLLSHEKDMVCGIYRQRLPRQTLEIYDLNIQNIAPEYVPKNSLIEIGGCGFGCVLVKKQIFVDVGYPQFEYHSALNHANTFSEDNDFCKKARAKEYKIYCDTSILCGHHGSMNYTVELPENPERERLLQLSLQKLLPVPHVKKLQELKDEGFNPRVIYDIGSCVLHWVNEAKNIFTDAKFCLFEAMDEVEFLYDDYDYSLGVLTDEDDKEIDFYQNVTHPGGNSYYRENVKLSPMAIDLFPEEKRVRKIGMTLDTVVRERNFPLPDLIKMDVQGAEMDILRGATETLKNCKYVILELQHVDYNEGAPKSNEVIEYMKSIGFDNLGNFTRTNVDGDYLFVNSIYL